MSHGFINDREKDPEAYIFGSGQLIGTVLQPNGQWDDYVPGDELQYLYGVEPAACASFGTLNCVEVLIDRVFGVKSNFSDRWLAWNSGTTTQGNSPHTVAETLRKAGVPLQSKWDITRDVNTFDKWYQTPPMGLFKEARLDFLNQYKIKHDYVNNDANSIKDALRFSPLGVSVGWNNKDSEGRWFKNGDGPDFHWVMMYGYVEGNHWKVFDSYDSSHKKLRWDAKPEMIKRFSISRANLSEEITIRMQLINALQRLIDLLRL